MGSWWLEHKFRMIQNNLRDIDGAMDVDAEIRMLKKMHANVVQLGCGGITAFSETMLECQKRSPYLQGDKFGELIEKCHANGIRVNARFDVSKVDEDFENVHPEWLLKNARGEHIHYNRTVVTCLNSDYQQKRTPEMLQEILRKYPVDVIFFNMFGYQTNDYDGKYFGICRCENCKRRFRELFDGDLDLVENPKQFKALAAEAEQKTYQAHAREAEPAAGNESLAKLMAASPEERAEAWKKYEDFKDYTVNDILEKIRSAIHEVRPETALSTYTDHAVDVIRTETNTAVDRPLPMWIYSASDNVSCIENTFTDKVSCNVGINAVDIPYRFMGVSDAFNRIRLYENIANRGNLDWCIIGAFPDYPDRSNFAGVEEVFRFQEMHQALYDRLKPLGKVLLVNPGSPYTGGVTDEYRGVFKALKHSHVAFDTIIDTDETDYEKKGVIPAENTAVDEGRKPLAGVEKNTVSRCEIDVEKAGVIIVPGIRKLKGNGLRNVLKRFEGKVILTAGAFTDEPELLKKFTGASALMEKHAVRGGYFETSPKEIFRSFPEQDWVYEDRRRWVPVGETDTTGSEAERTDKTAYSSILPYVKEAPYGPPERCYGHVLTEEPGVVCAEQGAAILFEIGALYFRQGYDAFRKVFMDVLKHCTALRRAADEKECRKETEWSSDLAPFTTNAHRSVEVITNRLDDDAYELELINLSGFDGVTVEDPVVQRAVSFVFDEAVDRVEEMTPEGLKTVKYEENGFTVPELGLHRAYVVHMKA